MSANELMFSYSMEGVDRNALLAQAAERIDALRGPLGPGETPVPSEDGNTIRTMIEEAATLTAFPEIYEITRKDYLARNLVAPVRFAELTKDYRFYWIRFGVGLLPLAGWVFNKLELRIEFNPDEPQAHLRPQAYQILPNKKLLQVFKMNVAAQVRLDENFELEVKAGPIAAQAGVVEGQAAADVGAVASGGLGAVLGPFSYSIKRAEIEHTDTNIEWVFWRLYGAKFVQQQEGDLQIVVIAKVPKKTKQVTVAGQLQAYRSLPLLTANLQDVIKGLPQALREFFQGGAPIVDKKTWDLTPRL